MPIAVWLPLLVCVVEVLLLLSALWWLATRLNRKVDGVLAELLQQLSGELAARSTEVQIAVKGAEQYIEQVGQEIATRIDTATKPTRTSTRATTKAPAERKTPTRRS